MVVHGDAWWCMVVHGGAWWCMVVHGGGDGGTCWNMVVVDEVVSGKALLTKWCEG